jgi:beta-lactamase class A
MRFNSICILLLIPTLGLGCTKSTITAETKFPSPAATIAQNQPGAIEQELEQRLKIICDRAQGTVSLAVVHIESGKTISINGKSQLPLYSVFKLPLAIAILKDVEESRLRLDQKIHVTPAEIVQGTPGNTAIWRKPVDFPIEKLIEFSISRSDNTSSDKLLQLAGGPSKVTERMRSLGFQNIAIRSTVAEYVKTRQSPNIGSAEDPRTTAPGKDPANFSCQVVNWIHGARQYRFASIARRFTKRHTRRRQNWFGREE